MRLIDADLLQEVLAKEPMENRTYLRANEIVVGMPTAYDVDKVVKMLQKDTVYREKYSNGYPEDEEYVELDKAIKAIKSGGSD